MACVPDREGAVREVAQVYERIKIQQPSTTTQLAHNLLSEALRALNVALSVMQQQAALADGPVTPSVKAEAQLSLHSPAAAAADSGATTSTARRGKRRRSVIEGISWANLITVPYEDGYEWRKYGEKKINGTTYTRNYFRCTYKDDNGCMATKQIQQKGNKDPPMFQVTYNNEHTCNCNTSQAKRNNSNNLPFLGYYNSEGAINPSNGGHVASVNQEPPQPLPPLADTSALPLDQTTFQEPLFPIPNQILYVTTVSAHHAGMPSTTSSTDSSWITGLSCDVECSGDMAGAAEAVEPAGEKHDPLRDLEFFLMYDIDKY